MLVKQLLIFSILVIGSQAASALPVYYTDRTAFQAAAGALTLESFEGPGQGAATHTYTDFQVSETGGATNFITNFLDNSVLNPVTQGSNAIWYDDNNNSQSSFYNFTGGGATAFGLDITANVSTTLSISGGAISDSLALGANSAAFWGVIDNDAISTIIFDASGGPNVGFDYVEYNVSAVPVPAAIWLFGTALLGFIGMSRKTKVS